MPATVLHRTLVAWTATEGSPRPQREREEHAYRWHRPQVGDAWVGEERACGPELERAGVGLPELAHDLRHQLTRAELEFEAGDPLRARAALAHARSACEEALGIRPPREVDLVALCSEEARGAARAHEGREIQTSLPRECSLACKAVELRRLLSNLLGNALRASGAGEAVHFALEREADGGARLSITDRGGGIEREVIDQLLGSRASGSGSTGIGTLSVLACAQRLGATIVVRSEAGAGSEFAVRLPG